MAAPNQQIDWDAIRLLYCAGSAPAVIARGILGSDAPLLKIERMVKTICNRVYREHWNESAARAQALIKDSPVLTSKAICARVRSCEEVGVAIRNNLGSDKKNYLETMSKAVSKATKLIDSKEFKDLEEVEESFLRHEPVHRVAKDIYELGKDVKPSQFTVNVMTAWTPESPPPEVIDV